MNAVLRRFSRVFGILLVAALLAGCATQKIDWSTRIGSFTYRQAVIELGPPDKKEKLDDATLVAEWLTAHGYAYSVPRRRLTGGMGLFILNSRPRLVITCG